jgi:quinohemoprotein ethanol dehydrogenase
MLAFGSLMLLPGCGAAPDSGASATQAARLDSDESAWWTNGRTLGEQRFAPQDLINTSNASQLGLAWEADLESPRFGIEASPIVVGGTMYVSSSWGRVFAYDARTGERLWAFDPEVNGAWLRNGCCKPVNRGVAYWNGKILVGAFDGRLFALDAKSGAKIWEADTTERKPYYTITGAPRVVNGKVIIGNGGADYGTRGFFSAYDADSGKRLWRFYVVPDAPSKGYEHPELREAARTWSPSRDWSIGGGGNPWDSFAYDPELNLLYVGTGNAGPFAAHNPAGGDGLFLSSILAINPDTGRLKWHYQTTPGDSWDFTATQNMILAELDIGGRQRKVLMQAPKNGFFYVLDRETGELISASNYVHVNWASGINLKTGKPILTGIGDYRKGASLVFPSAFGGHNWHPMAYNPQTGLVYIPARDIGWIWGADRPTFFMRGKTTPKLEKQGLERGTRGLLIAWDPKRQTAAWTVPQDTYINGGVLTTAGNLVIQGTEDGYLRFYDAKTGKMLHQMQTGTGIVAPPISYTLDGVQYLAVAAGWNGVKMTAAPPDAPAPFDNSGRLIVLRLGGGPLPVAERVPIAKFLDVKGSQPLEMITKGLSLYQTHCAVCHGALGDPGVMPDLRRMTPAVYDAFDAIVLDGALEGGGMAGFADVLNKADVHAIRAFVADWAQRSRRGDTDPLAKGASPPQATAKPKAF